MKKPSQGGTLGVCRGGLATILCRIVWAVVSMFALGFTFASLVLVRGGWSLADCEEFRPFPEERLLLELSFRSHPLPRGEEDE